ncbi:hypothetical protein [Desulforhopalus sp. 52FAK]
MEVHTGAIIITDAITITVHRTNTITGVVIEVVIDEDSPQLNPGGLNMFYFRPLVSFEISFECPS